MKDIFWDKKLNQAFDRMGYVKIPFLDEQQVRDLIDIYEFQVSDSLSGFHSSMHLQNHDLRRNLDGSIKNIVREQTSNILREHVPLFANYLVKEAGGESEVGIHQDWTYVDEDEHISINIWCPLVDTNAQNGALCVLEGSHVLKAPVRYTPYEQAPWEIYNDLIRHNAHLIHCKAGEAVVYNTRLIHWSDANRSSEKRTAIAYVTVPSTAETIHFHRNNGKPILEKFKVDADFYNTYKIGSRPEGVEKIGEVPIDTNCFGIEELEALNRIMETGQHI